MQENKLNLMMNILKFGLVAIGAILCVLIIGGPNADSPDPDAIVQFREGGKLGAAIGYTGLMLIACVTLVLGFFVYQLIKTPKKTFMSIVGLIISAILFLILYLVGTSDTNETLALRDPVSDGTIRFTTAGIYTIAVALIASIVVVVMGLFSKLRK